MIQKLYYVKAIAYKKATLDFTRLIDVRSCFQQQKHFFKAEPNTQPPLDDEQLSLLRFKKRSTYIRSASLQNHCSLSIYLYITMVLSGLTANSLFVWLWLVLNDRKFSAGTVFFSHTNQSAVLFHEPATKRTSQPNMLQITKAIFNLLPPTYVPSPTK